MTEQRKKHKEGRVAHNPARSLRSERQDAVEHRQQILQVARALFAEHGVDNVSMHQIAQAAGVGQGTLYRKFAHKGMLCLAILAQSTQQAQHEFQVYIESTEDAPLTQLEKLFRNLMNFNEENASLLAAMLDAATGERRTSAYDNPFYSWLRYNVATLLQRAIEQKEIAPLDIEYSADALLSPFAIDLYLYQRYKLNFTPERIANGIYRLLFEGLLTCKRL